MPRYYFDLVDCDGEHIDENGVQCEHLDAAIVMARRTISDIARDVFRETDQTELSIRIRDHDEGPVVIKVTMDTSGRP